MRLYHSDVWQVALLLLFVFIGQGGKVNCQNAPDTSTNEIKQLVSLYKLYHTSNSVVREVRALEDENQEEEIEDDLFLEKRKSKQKRRRKPVYSRKYKFEDLSKFNGNCFDFKFMLSRIMGGFPTPSSKNITEIKLDTVHIRALADRTLTMIKVVRRPDLIAKDLVFSLSEKILTDLKNCPSTQLHQALMYGLSRSFVAYKKNNFKVIRNVIKKVKRLTRRARVSPLQLIQTVYNTLSMNLLEHIRQADYKELEETMTKLEKDLEKLLKEEDVDVNKIQSMVTSRLGSVRRCGNDQSVGKMFGKMAMVMQQLSKGLDRKDIAASLGALKRYVPRRNLQNVITQLRNLSRHMLANLQKLFKALVGKKKSYIINQKILDKDQYEQLLRILNFFGKDLFSGDKIKQLGKRDLSDVMDDEVQAFQFEKKDSSNLDKERQSSDNQDKRQITNNSLKALLTWIKSQIKKNKSRSRSKSMKRKRNRKRQPKVKHCFNFDSAVSKIIGGFPSVKSPAAKVVLGKNDFNGVIEKSLTLERLMNQPYLATQELVYSMSEKVLEKQKLCPSAMLGRVLFYALARSFDNYETKISKGFNNLLKKTAKGKYAKRVITLIDQINQWSIVKLLTEVRSADYLRTKRTMQRLFSGLLRELKKADPSVESVKKVIFRKKNKWSWNCSSDVSVRQQLIRTKRKLTYLIRSMAPAIRYHLQTLKVRASVKKRIARSVQSLTTGFLRNLDKLFKALLTRNRDYLQKNKILTKSQFENYEKILAAIGGKLLPGFAVPVTRNELQLLMRLQQSLLTKKPLNQKEAVELVGASCKQLQYVYIPQLSSAEVKKFFQNCKMLNTK